MKDTKFVIEKWAGSGLAKWGEGSTFSDAIRNAGVRCETCEHFNMAGECETYDGKQGYEDNGHGWDVPVKSYKPDFFCAHHSSLAEDKA